MVRRRGEKITAARDGLIGAKRKQRDDDTTIAAEDSDDQKSSARSGKKTKRDHKDKNGKARDRKLPRDQTESKKPVVVEKKGIEKEGQNIGSMIGRKRRRKAGK